MALRELIASFGVEIDDAKLKGFEKSIDSVKGKLESFASTLGLALGVGAVGAFLSSQINLGSAINDTAEKLGVATDELQKFQYAAKINGGVGAEEAAHSLGFLNKALGEAASGNAEAAKGFMSAGVAIKDADGKTRPALDVLGDLADHFKATDDPTKKAALAMSTFGRAGQSLIPLLNQGGDGLRAMYAEADALGGVLDAKLVKAADDAGDQVDRLKFAAQGLANRVMVAVLPILTSVVTAFTDWTTAAGEVLQSSTAIESALLTLAIVGGVAAAVWAILNIEIFAVLLALALLYVAVDEIYGLFTGADSVIGRFVDSLFGVGVAGTAVEDVKLVFDEMWTSISSLEPLINGVIRALAPLWNAFKVTFGPALIKMFQANLLAVITIVKLMVQNVQNFTRDLGNLIRTVAGNKIFSAAIDKAFGEGSAQSLSDLGTGLAQATTAKATLPGGSAKFEDKKASLIDLKNNTTITINGATDPEATRDAVYGALQDSQDDAQDALFGGAYGEDVE